MALPSGRYRESERFLRAVDPHWEALVEQVGPCRHEPRAAREPYEALIHHTA